MAKRIQNFVYYWRNSLTDATFNRGALTEKEIESFILGDKAFKKSGRVSKQITEILFKEESNKCQLIEIILMPIVYRNKLIHTANDQKIPSYILPLSTAAILARNGKCYPMTNNTLIARDILAPLEKGSFAIGTTDDLDHYLMQNNITGIDYVHYDDEDPSRDEKFTQQWENYLKESELLLSKVTHQVLDRSEIFERLENSYFVKKETIKGVTRHILPLYDKLKVISKPLPLFEKFAAQTATPKQLCLASDAFFSKRLAHVNDQFALTVAQRDTLTHLLSMQEGDILAVNGPPGTGKTTLLLSIVASLWAKRAMEKSDPPIIVAASTNNQAVTNIIDAFGKDFSSSQSLFSRRWLPDIQSFCAYFPAKSKATQAEMHYQTEAFFKKVETIDYYNQAKRHYLSCAAQAFPNFNHGTHHVRDIVDQLHCAIKSEVNQLQQIETVWENLVATRQAVQHQLGIDPIQIKMVYEQQLQSQRAQQTIWQTVEDGWQSYLAQESLAYLFFSWLPAVRQKRYQKATVYLKKIWPKTQEPLQWNTIEEISTLIEHKKKTIDLVVQKTQQAVQQAKQLLINLDHCLTEWQLVLSPLGINDNAQTITLTEVDPIVDTRLRFNLFLLTTHYWEGRWILEMEENLFRTKGHYQQSISLSTEKKWYLRMKLTPCVVSTFYMLPSYFINDRIQYGNDYLYNFIDLLIVDEAALVRPEVAGASFALSKKALVIGDTRQIEPIWNIPRKIDIGNLQKAKLMTNQNIIKVYDQLSQLGKTASSGSVMKIAQHASRYHYDSDMEPGMFLYEHHRCYDEIINFCNELVYQGKLRPERGCLGEKSLFPAFAYLHINGLCQTTYSGSRFNKLEAKVIAQWIMQNKEKIEQKYQQSITKIIGIITPFLAQALEIKKAISALEMDIDLNERKESIAIGTVHAFQGAERHIIIFSAVYSKHADGNMIDNRASLLNVAVSRAKDHFLFFGDIDILNPAQPTPRGVLARHLFRHKSNELTFNTYERDDLIESKNITLRVLRDAKEHDHFLQYVLNNAKNELIIVSPWLTLAAIEYINLLSTIEPALQRNINVSIYSDLRLNIPYKKEKQRITREKLNEIIMLFTNKGINIQLMSNIHSKLIIKDDDLLCVGSFNWLSAPRKGKYVRHETSLTYQGKSQRLKNEIKCLKESFIKEKLY